jgi:hypothetical protein
MTRINHFALIFISVATIQYAKLPARDFICAYQTLKLSHWNLEVEENEKVNKEEERIQGQHVEIEDFKEKMLLFNF